MSERIKFRMYSLRDFYDRALAERVLETILAAPSNIAPVAAERDGSLQALPTTNASEFLASAWMNDEACREGRLPEVGVLGMEGSAPAKASYLVSWDRTPKEIFNLASLSAAASTVATAKGMDAFLNLALALVELLNGVWGEVTWSVPRTSNASTLFDLRKRMPPPGWMLIFGEPYIQLFGEDLIRSTPCHKVGRLQSGHYLIQTTARPSELLDANLIKAICSHLGRDAFQEPGESIRAYRTGLAPVFDFRKQD